jgi:hypothetical protein
VHGVTLTVRLRMGSRCPQLRLVATVAASLSLADEAALRGQNFNEAARGRRCFVASRSPTFTSSRYA